MIFMRYIFGICIFTVKYIVAMFRYAKKPRLRHNLLCYCFHRSVSDCPVEARRSREKKGFFLAAISKFRSWQKLEFLEKILEFLEKSLEFFEILEFFWPWVFFKMSKKKAWFKHSETEKVDALEILQYAQNEWRGPQNLTQSKILLEIWLRKRRE